MTANHRKLFIVLIVSATVFQLSAQDNSTNEYDFGNVSGRIFSNFHYNMTSSPTETAFEIKRAYFGYEKQLNKYFSANVKLDIGSPDDISEYSRIRRYAYFKNAGLTYQKEALTVWAGLFDMRQFKVQEKFWGYRYLYKSYMDEYRFGPSADLGAGISYKFSNRVSGDFVMSNGEGHSAPQRDNIYKAGWGITIQPIQEIQIRTYYAIFLTDIPQMTLSIFTGYRKGDFRIGGEYNFQRNYLFNFNHNRFGYSAYTTYIFNDQLELFVRFDQLFSNVTENNEIPWNLPNDGSALVGGIQFSPIPAIHLTLDYQDWFEYAGNGEKEQILFIHMEINF